MGFMDKAEDKMKDVLDGADDAAHDFGNKLKEKSGDMQDAIKGAGDKAMDAMGDMKDGATKKLDELGSKIKK